MSPLSSNKGRCQSPKVEMYRKLCVVATLSIAPLADNVCDTLAPSTLQLNCLVKSRLIFRIQRHTYAFHALLTSTAFTKP